MTLKTKYRIVRDRYAGYELQFKPWWFPFWLQASSSGSGIGINTCASIEHAERLAAKHASGLVVKVFTPDVVKTIEPK